MLILIGFANAGHCGARVEWVCDCHWECETGEEKVGTE